MMAARIFSILSVLAVGVTAAPHDKRSIESGVTIYAYGTEISGLPIYSDADGMWKRNSNLVVIESNHLPYV